MRALWYRLSNRFIKYLVAASIATLMLTGISSTADQAQASSHTLHVLSLVCLWAFLGFALLTLIATSGWVRSAKRRP